MIDFILSRLLSALLVILGVACLVFLLLHLTPGDPVDVMLGESARPADREAMRTALGLDKPLGRQLVDYFAALLRLDLGSSLHSKLPVSQLLAERLPATLQLALAALVCALLVALPLGLLAAVKRGSAWDWGAMGFSLLGVSMPNFWLGPVLILVFSLWLGWTPVSGRDAPASLILPALTLGTAFAAILARMIRSSLLEVLGEDYVRTARAKGLARIPGGLAACHAQRLVAGGDPAGPAAGGAARRRGGDRDRVRLARHRLSADPGDPAAGLSGGAGLCAVHQSDLRAGEYPHRSGLRPDRSAHPSRRHECGSGCLAEMLLLWALAALMAAPGSRSRRIGSTCNGFCRGPVSTGLLGFDDLGRPILERLLAGARTSFLVAFGVVGITAVVGTGLGLLAGYRGGWLDLLLVRLIEIFLAFPGILLAIALAGVMGPGLDNLVIALAVVGWVGYARLARAQALSLKQRDHVTAAVALGSRSGGDPVASPAAVDGRAA